MEKQILQIENTNTSEFIPKLTQVFKDVLKEHSSNSKETDILLTREETANMLSISLVTLWKFTKDDVIPAYRIGTRVRYKKSDVLLALKKMNKF